MKAPSLWDIRFNLIWWNFHRFVTTVLNSMQHHQCLRSHLQKMKRWYIIVCTKVHHSDLIISKQITWKILAESTNISKNWHKSCLCCNVTHGIIRLRGRNQRPQHLRWYDDAKSALATDRSFVNWASRQQNLVRVRHIENLLMFFPVIGTQKIVEIPRLEQSYRDLIVTQWGHRFTQPDSA